MQKKTFSQIEIAAFCEQIALILHAGLPIHHGIALLQKEDLDSRSADLYSSLYTPLEEGQKFHKALEQTGLFPSYVIRMISFGEATGRLEDVLRSLSRYYNRDIEIQKEFRHAIIFPLIMMGFLSVIILLLSIKVIPSFALVYESLEDIGEFSSRLLMLSNSVSHIAVWFIELFILGFLLLFLFSRTEIGKLLLYKNKLSLSLSTSQLANCLYLALASGFDSDQGLDFALTIIDNPYLQEKIQKCKEHIRHGEGFDKALLKSAIFAPFYTSWITIGYKTGSMEEVMSRISESYEKKNEELLAKSISNLETGMIILLFLLVALILISFLLPLLGLLSSIG